jgi:hypothetical protein
MKKAALFSTLTALLLVSGCSTPTVPSTPKQKSGKYALQFIRIETTVSEQNASQMLSNTNPTTDAQSDWRALSGVPNKTEDLLKNPEAVIIEYPIVYAAVGETAVNDQTKHCHLPETFKVVPDKTGNPEVVYSDEIKGLGRFVEFTVSGVENGKVSYHVIARDTELAGMQNYDTGVEDKNQKKLIASLPVFKKTGIDTAMTQTPGTWIGMGGLISEKTENVNSGEVKKIRIKKFMFVRVLPPKDVPFRTTQPTPKVYRFPVSELEKTTP